MAEHCLLAAGVKQTKGDSTSFLKNCIFICIKEANFQVMPNSLFCTDKNEM